MNSLANVLPPIIQADLLDCIAYLGLDFLAVANKASFCLGLMFYREALNNVREIVYNCADITISG